MDEFFYITDSSSTMLQVNNEQRFNFTENSGQPVVREFSVESQVCTPQSPMFTGSHGRSSNLPVLEHIGSNYMSTLYGPAHTQYSLDSQVLATQAPYFPDASVHSPSRPQSASACNGYVNNTAHTGGEIWHNSMPLQPVQPLNTPHIHDSMNYVGPFDCTLQQQQLGADITQYQSTMLTDSEGTFIGFSLVDNDVDSQPTLASHHAASFSMGVPAHNTPSEHHAPSQTTPIRGTARAWKNCVTRHLAQPRSPASPELNSFGQLQSPGIVRVDQSSPVPSPVAVHNSTHHFPPAPSPTSNVPSPTTVVSVDPVSSDDESVQVTPRRVPRAAPRAVSKRKLQLETVIPKCDDDLLISQRQHQWRRLKGRLYRYGYTWKSGVEVWRCVNKKCRGSATLDGNVFELKSKCTVWEILSKAKLQVLMKVNKAKILWARGVNVREACDLIREECSPEELKLLPDPDILARKVRRVAEGSRKYDEYPLTSGPEEEWLQFRGASMLLHNNTRQCESSEAIIVFGSNFGRTALKEGSRQVHLDGEFKRVPPNYQQVYNVGCIYEGKYVNIFTVLLGSKNQYMYTKMWEVLSDLADFSLVEGFHIDFEQGAINAIRTAFPSIPIHGCYFHLLQNLLCQAEEKGLEIEEDDLDARVFDLVYHLSFLPPADIRAAFLEIMSFIGTLPVAAKDHFEGFMLYFAKFYVGQTDEFGREKPARFPPTLWSVYHRLIADLPITNNASESYNAEFGRYCRRNPTLYVYTRSLRRLWKHHKTVRDQAKAKNTQKPPTSALRVTEESLAKKDLVLKPRYAGQTWISYLEQLK